MIDKLRKKFVVVAVASVTLMIVIIMSVLGIINYSSMNTRMGTLVELIESNNGELIKPDRFDKQHKPNPKLPREALFDTRYFLVYYNEFNEISYTNLGNIYSVTPKEASEYASIVLSRNDLEGYYDNYKFKVSRIAGQKVIIFVDATRELAIFMSFIYNSLAVSVLALILTGIIAYIFSPRAIMPIVTAYNKQKRFITDASHEIKTPLTIISANLDILELQQGENKWIKSSSEQVTRLTRLVNSLTALSRLEEQTVLNKSEFDISEVFKSCIRSYESVVKNDNKSIHNYIEEAVIYDGDKHLIEQLAYIVIDNAVKYCSPEGEIQVDLKKQDKRIGDKKINIVVKNTADNIEVGSHEEYFDRFYKADKSRSKNENSFGIGLALAKQIVESHKGRINAYSNKVDEMIIEINI